MKLTPAAVFVLFTFRAVLTQSVTAFTNCGGVLTEDGTGKNIPTISSPYYPSDYPNDADCTWLIETAAKTIIDLRFQVLDLDGYGNDCPDGITIYDGPSAGDKVLATVCRQMTSDALGGLIIRSTGNKMLVRFTSNGLNTGQGFVFKFWSHVCAPLKYGLEHCDKDCTTPSQNTLSCDNVNGKYICKPGWKGENCTVDINECTDLPYERCPSYQTCVNSPGSFVCQCLPGLVLNPQGRCVVAPQRACQRSMCSHLCVRLPGENSNRCYCPDNTRLKRNINRFTCAACGPLNFGKNCLKSCRCASGKGRCKPETGGCTCNPGWTSADCSQDVNECTDTKIATNCTNAGRVCINTPGSYRCDCARGFQLQASKCVAIKCTKRIDVSPPRTTSGTIETPFPYYTDTYWPNALCSWTIVVNSPRMSISLKVNNLPSDNTGDYISVYDGVDTNAQLLGSYDQGNPPISVVRSTTNMMHVVFRSDGRYESGIFNAVYKAVDYPTCKQTMKVDFTRTPIQSSVNPIYPSYQNNIFCYWLVTRTVGNTLSLRKTSLNVDPKAKSFLAVYDGSHAGAPLIGKYFGTTMPSLIRTSGTAMYIVFQSDGSNVGNGFSGKIHAQNCPAFYYGLEECIIPCKCVQPNSVSCDNMYGTCSCRPGWRSDDCSVDINECDENPSICTETEKCINTLGSYYCQPDCDQEFTENQPILTKKYNQIRLNRARCNFNIIGGPGNVISVVFDDFQLLEKENCGWDSLEVYNNPLTSNKLIGRYCGTRRPRVIRSTDTSMLLKLSTSYYDTRRGFRGQIYIHECPPFTYGVICDKTCKCDQAKTDFCDNINGFCVCKKGWTGDFCTKDVDECRFTKCSTNEECKNSKGSFSCECKRGFEKNGSPVCTRMQCTTSIKEKCSDYCYYDIDRNTDVCGCSDGKVLGSTEDTAYQCVVPYYPYSTSYNDLSISTSSITMNAANMTAEPITFTSPLPFGDNLKSEAYVYSNGLISFEQLLIPFEPDLKVFLNNKNDLISAFWADIDPTAGQTFYHLYEKCDPSIFNLTELPPLSPSKEEVMERAARDVITFTQSYDFDVNTVLVVTSTDLKQSDQPPDAPGNTFQTVLISGNKKERSSDSGFSDEETSYVLYIYQKGQMLLPDNENRKVAIGYVASPYSRVTEVIIENKAFNFARANYIESVMFQVSKQTSPKQKCQRHVCQNSYLITNYEYQTEIEELDNCPCTIGQLGLQWTLFQKRGSNIYCYAFSTVAKKLLLASNPRNKLCCYYWDLPPSNSDWEKWANSIALSSYIHNTADAGHILVGDLETSKGVKESLDAHTWCCRDSQDAEMCSRFNLIYPDNECSYDVRFAPAYLLGDPHIITFDDKTYTVNVLGEYTLMDVPSAFFTLQARTSQIKSSEGVLTNATVFTAFAAKEKNYARFQVELSSDKKSMVILVDGVSYTDDFYKSTTFRLTKEYIEVFRDNRFNKVKVGALFPSNVIVEVNVGVDCLELNLEVDDGMRGKTRGLLGNFNGDKDDEFLLPNGTILPVNMTEEQIYTYFASKYQVTADTSVFIYSNGMTAANYTQVDFKPVFRSSLNVSAAMLANATDICGVGEELCIYDYLVTGDKRFALNTKSTQALSIASRKALENKIPRLEVDYSSAQFIKEQWIVQEGVVNTLRFTATDEDGDPLTYVLSDNPKNVKINDSGILTYTPNSLEPVAIGVRVKDIKKGYSPWLFLPILICTGCTNHGTCNANKTRSLTYGNGKVKIMKCDCYPGYTGDSCETKSKACKINPCSTGQKCTELTAAQQGNSSIGYVCGPCPAGLEDVNHRCTDKDECNDTSICDQICNNTLGSYECSCNEGFLLNTTDSKSCFAKNCSNRCVPENTLYCNESISKCVCKPGITTEDCSVPVIDSCLSNPCLNNLLCKQKGNNYECLCRNGLPLDSGNKCTDCNRTLTEPTGKIMSTNYPANYPDESYCTWTIVSEEPAAIITLNITDLDVEGCPFDYLEVYDGYNNRARLIGQYCEDVPDSIVSSANVMYVVFVSDSSVNLRGFMASYTASTQCRIKKCSHSCQVVSANPRVETCVCPPWTTLDSHNDSQCLEINTCNSRITTSSGYIVSPNYPQKYAANLTCSWFIQVSTLATITLSFSDLDMEIVGSSCAYDSLTVYSGNSSSGVQLAKFCGTVIPQNVTASTRTGMYMVFKSDGSFFGRGFKAQFIVR